MFAALHACSTVGAAECRTDIIDTACAPDVDLSPLLVATIDAAAQLLPPPLATADLRTLAEHCAGVLRRELAQPARAEDDWSIEFDGDNCCQDCTELTGFLHDSARNTRVTAAVCNHHEAAGSS